MVYPWLSEGRQQGRKRLAVLIDPDKTTLTELSETLTIIQDSGADLILVGGSLLISGRLSETVRAIKVNSNLPVVLFPGSPAQITPDADAILLLSLISGRNPDLLIGQQVVAAPMLKRSGLEILPTGYLLVDGGTATTVSYISNTEPIPANKPDIAAMTALAGTQLGLNLIYLDAGSGAQNSVPEQMVKAVSDQVDVPLVVGGGIRHPETARALCLAGADILVVGNAAEEDPSILKGLAEAVHGSDNE